MRAAIISERNAPPVVGEFRDPQPQDGAVLIDVDTAGLGAGTCSAPIVWVLNTRVSFVAKA